jgi:predicted RNA-binding protein Jag
VAEYIEKEAKTVESAIEEALNEMNIGKDGFSAYL